MKDKKLNYELGTGMSLACKMNTIKNLNDYKNVLIIDPKNDIRNFENLKGENLSMRTANIHT